MPNIFVTTVAMLLGLASARPSFPDRVPNGRNVWNPCADEQWKPFGHQAPWGPSVNNLNQFGKDFRDNGYQWSSTFCNLDSDGDGKSNGMELGDPTCVWSVGRTPYRTSNIGNPGICEPVTTDECKAKNTFLNTSNCAKLAEAAYDDEYWKFSSECTCYCLKEDAFRRRGRGNNRNKRDANDANQGGGPGGRRPGQGGGRQSGGQGGQGGGRRGRRAGKVQSLRRMLNVARKVQRSYGPPIADKPEFEDATISKMCTCTCN